MYSKHIYDHNNIRRTCDVQPQPFLLTIQVVLRHSESACTQRWLAEACTLTTSREILLWMTPSEAPKALQASECSELLDPMRASCWISAQH